MLLTVAALVLDGLSFCVRCCTNTGLSSEEKLDVKVCPIRQRQRNLSVSGKKENSLVQLQR